MPKIVQFTHPGPEHGPDKRNGNLKSWNTGNRKHKRKFLLSNGEYVIDNQLKEGELAFWGEWEPPSHVEKIQDKPNKYFPTWIHRPYLPEVLPNSDGYQTSYQNTDPCVFGDSFKYFVYKQHKPKNGRITTLAKLEKGSIILFGSTANQNKPDSYFQLDTVFVISDYIEYDTSDPNALSDIGIYRDFVFKMAFPEPTVNSLKLRLYIGANFHNPIEGMYSFSPAQIWNNNKSGFPRIPLSDMDFITNNLNAAPKISEASIEQVKEFWNKLVEITKNNNCVQGLNFKYGK